MVQMCIVKIRSGKLMKQMTATFNELIFFTTLSGTGYFHCTWLQTVHRLSCL